MAVSVTSFRADLPEFKNRSQYPDAVIQYWLSMAGIILGIGVQAPPTVCSFQGSIAGDILTVSAINFGSISLLPLLLQGTGIPNLTSIVTQLTGPAGQAGTYGINVSTLNIASENMVAIQANISLVGNNFWGNASLVASSPPTTLADFATEMWVAHQIVLEKQALAAAATGADPGTKIGIVSSKSVNGVSVSFDTSSIAGGKMQENAGYYNQTIYGMRFYRLMKLRGAGPIQLGIGRAPPFLFFNSWGLLGSSNAWPGPWPGIEMGDTGFSS